MKVGHVEREKGHVSPLNKGPLHLLKEMISSAVRVTSEHEEERERVRAERREEMLFDKMIHF